MIAVRMIDQGVEGMAGLVQEHAPNCMCSTADYELLSKPPVTNQASCMLGQPERWAREEIAGR